MITNLILILSVIVMVIFGAFVELKVYKININNIIKFIFFIFIIYYMPFSSASFDSLQGWNSTLEVVVEVVAGGPGHLQNPGNQFTAARWIAEELVRYFF